MIRRPPRSTLFPTRRSSDLAGLVAVGGAIGVVKGAIVTLAAVLAANPVTLALLGVGVVAGAGVAAVNMYAKTAAGIEDAIATLRVENERSEARSEERRVGKEGRSRWS